MKIEKIIKWIPIIFILSGIILSLINFFNFRSLWLDEAMLSLNIANKSAAELLHPLDENQVAPIGFLLVEKLFASIFGNTDWSLRIFPMISFFLSIVVLYSFVKKTFKNLYFVFSVTAFFATSFITIHYSSEVKQYMLDILFGLVILRATINYNSEGINLKWWIFALLGAISVWFSNIAVLVLFTVGIYSMYSTYFSNKNKYKQLFFIFGSWITSFSIYYVFFIHNHPTREAMVAFWGNNEAFLPKNIFSSEFLLALKSKLILVLGLSHSNVLVSFFTFFSIIGLFYLWRHKKGLFFLLVFPLILHLTLSYFNLYPFGSRLILYLFPNMLIVVFSGFCFIDTIFKKNRQIFLYLLPLFTLVNIIVLFEEGFPMEKEEVKKSIQFINSNIEDKEDLYIYHSANDAFKFYKNYLRDKNINRYVSVSNRNDWLKYNTLITSLGDSVWILFSHVYWVKNEDNLDEEAYVIKLFEQNGYQIIDQKQYVGSSAYHAVKRTPTKQSK